MLQSIFASLEGHLPRIHHLVISIQRRRMAAKTFEGAVLFQRAVLNRFPPSASGVFGLKIGH